MFSFSSTANEIRGEWWPIEAVALTLHIRARAARHLARTGQLRSTRVGNRWLFEPSAVRRAALFPHGRGQRAAGD